MTIAREAVMEECWFTLHDETLGASRTLSFRLTSDIAASVRSFDLLGEHLDAASVDVALAETPILSRRRFGGKSVVIWAGGEPPSRRRAVTAL